MNQKYNILVLGSGAREHALCWKLSKSSRVSELFIAPGNGGTGTIAKNLPADINNFGEIKELVAAHKIGMVVVGPELPIVNGIVDYFKNDEQLKSIRIIAPCSNGARLEGSKSFAKQFMLKYNIPTAKYHIVNKENIAEGIYSLSTFSPPYVLKADGLASGKGVIIAHEKDEATAILTEMLNGKFGEASKTIVIEQYIKGVEISVFVLTDGTNYLILPEAKDYKRIGVGDTGPNTGGMGAVSPVHFVDDNLMKKIEKLIIYRTIYGLKKENISYKGFIFIGLMIRDNEPFVIEYNIRLGDPEAEVVLPRIRNDLVDLFEAAYDGTLNNHAIDIDETNYATVIAASGGYPGEFQKGKIISGTEKVKDSFVFHAGTRLQDNQLITNGGRVFAVSSSGVSLSEAVSKSLGSLKEISYDGMYFRNDIGYEFI